MGREKNCGRNLCWGKSAGTARYRIILRHFPGIHIQFAQKFLILFCIVIPLDDENKETVLTRFVKVDPKDVKDKIVLTLACNDFDWDVRNRVVSFNKTNEKI